MKVILINFILFVDNAIEFITDMLSKCLMFRSGYGEPPLLYNRKHIEELFNLMDPMRTGYINYNQYKAGCCSTKLYHKESN